MRLWNIKKLIEELREDSLSQKKKFYYFLTFFILFVWIGLVLQYIPVEVNLGTVRIQCFSVTKEDFRNQFQAKPALGGQARGLFFYLYCIRGSGKF